MFVFSKGRATCNQIKDRRNRKAGTSSIHTIRKANGKTRNMYADSRKIKIGKNGVRFNIWEISPEQSSKNRLHPAVFSEQIANDHIISWSNEGDTVLDPMMGSGTTGKMAKRINRSFIGIEKDAEYFKIAWDRIYGAN